MAKKIIRLTERELNNVIKKVVNEALQEIGGKTLSIVPNVSIDAVDNIQRGNTDKVINPNKTVSYDSQIVKANKLYPKAVQSFLAPYIGFTFMFFAYARLGNVVHLLFNVNSIKKLMDGKALLSGNVIFGDEQLPGDLLIDFTSNKVFYTYKGNSYKYVLEPDNRTVGKWNELLQGLRDSLNARIKRG